jgi:predicted glycoside hydrolase/deacetylase ChbG (UPF0249 family)
MRRLIVNADDFGLTPGVNGGIIEAHERGIVTSTSLMTRWPAAMEAAEYARSHPRLGVGLHIDLGEWVYRNGNWEPLYEIVSPDDPKSVEAEIHRQLHTFRDLLHRDPDHLDSHQHAHRNEPVRSITLRIASDLSIPLRHFSEARYRGEFYGQDEEGKSYPQLISFDALARLIHNLDPGCTELCCHPASTCDLETTYRHERMAELKTLCDPRLRRLLAEAGVELRSFATR